jgi:hypothetical protein
MREVTNVTYARRSRDEFLPQAGDTPARCSDQISMPWARAPTFN